MFLELVFELDLLGDGDAVLGDPGRAQTNLFEHDVAALGSERDLDRIIENIDAAQHPVAWRRPRNLTSFGSH